MAVKNNTWLILEKRAQRRVASAMADVLKAGESVTGLEGSEARMNQLISEYRSKLAAVESGTHSIGDNMNCRRYIAHIEEVKERLNASLVAAREKLAAAKYAHRMLEAERAKMAGLADRAKTAEERGRALRDQKGLDSLAIARFNLAR